MLSLLYGISEMIASTLLFMGTISINTIARLAR